MADKQKDDKKDEHCVEKGKDWWDAKTKKRAQELAQLMEFGPKKLVQSGRISVYMLPKLKKAYDIMKKLIEDDKKSKNNNCDMA